MNAKALPHTKGAADLFSLGQIVATPGALDLLMRHRISPIRLLLKHVRGDWGNLDPEDAAANHAALCGNARILSSYAIDGDDRVWIITEGDRSVTTLLLPSEY